MSHDERFLYVVLKTLQSHLKTIPSEERLEVMYSLATEAVKRAEGLS